jgi:hypothetical protein
MIGKGGPLCASAFGLIQAITAASNTQPGQVRLFFDLGTGDNILLNHNGRKPRHPLLIGFQLHPLINIARISIGCNMSQIELANKIALTAAQGTKARIGCSAESTSARR